MSFSREEYTLSQCIALQDKDFRRIISFQVPEEGMTANIGVRCAAFLHAPVVHGQGRPDKVSVGSNSGWLL